MAICAAITICGQKLQPFLCSVSPWGTFTFGDCGVMLHAFSLPIFPVVVSCRSPQLAEIAAPVISALCVIRVAQLFSLGAQNWIRSFPVYAPPFSLVGIPLIEVARSPFVGGSFLFLRMTGAPSTTCTCEFGAILACPSLLGA